jgi:hypothetical protein
MSTRTCPPLRTVRARAQPSLFRCNPKTGRWIADPGLACSPKSVFANDERFACNKLTGRYRLGRGYQRVRVEGAPKRPLTAFFAWMMENRPAFKRAHPELKSRDIVRALAEQWRAMPVSEKQRYAGAMMEYKQARSAYRGPLTEIRARPVKPLSKRKSAPRAPRISQWREPVRSAMVEPSILSQYREQQLKQYKQQQQPMQMMQAPIPPAVQQAMEMLPPAVQKAVQKAAQKQQAKEQLAQKQQQPAEKKPTYIEWSSKRRSELGGQGMTLKQINNTLKKEWAAIKAQQNE